MSSFRVDQIDHVELFVPDRHAAARWYERVLGLSVAPELAHFAADPRGPLMLTTVGAGTKLALFTGTPQGDRPPAGFHRVAFRVSRAGFDAFRAHVRDNPVFGEQGEEVWEPAYRDRGACWSFYFRDPYGHQLEVTTYEVEPVDVTG
jgi:catechol 2,3-dioxygenase-like lactoylglutathione lyase family enzyme